MSPGHHPADRRRPACGASRAVADTHLVPVSAPCAPKRQRSSQGGAADCLTLNRRTARSASEKLTRPMYTQGRGCRRLWPSRTTHGLPVSSSEALDPPQRVTTTLAPTNPVLGTSRLASRRSRWVEDGRVRTTRIAEFGEGGQQGPHANAVSTRFGSRKRDRRSRVTALPDDENGVKRVTIGPKCASESGEAAVREWSKLPRFRPSPPP